MNGFQWFLTALNNSFKFSGRARRAEFAWFTLIATIISIPISLLSTGLPKILDLLINIIYLIPSTSVTTRRLHDLGYSGWLQTPFTLLGVYFIFAEPPEAMTNNEVYGYFLIILISLSFLLYLVFKDGQRKDNAYGKDPKGELEKINN
ncbi:MAG: DUF805 domain-containing protein [Neisseriaceae bacterium]|nr:MAG: DUF805 domain-containing protein [Neisseriaceae bacterium]